ncbi:uncharacterized protein LOC123431062 [Hordeum vulgare subsp. vulgare]|uniref:uncharacterized protein LOC123431062 n=1 Tax=Hordeum vulgare subsp. vulgare TaxID=112509 RepID=UPI001D1A37E8|nr:uncharacterized protein LOC123431062 [Hordeum vulgare subsp. vulgare]
MPRRNMWGIGPRRCWSYSLFCQDLEKETEEVEPLLDPINASLGDGPTVNMFRMNSRLIKVGKYIARLRAAVGKIDKELWPEDDLQSDLEAMMTRLEQIPERVQAWKKSAARCGADVALSLVRVHCKEARKDKLKTLQVANTKKLRFEDFMKTFIDTATRIADGIDLTPSWNQLVQVSREEESIPSEQT